MFLTIAKGLVHSPAVRFHFLCAKHLTTVNHSREPIALGTAITEPSLPKPPFAQKNEVPFGILVACISLTYPQCLPSQRHFKEKI